MEIKQGQFVISLDFELLWGVFDKVDFKSKSNYFLNTRKIIPSILEMLEDHGVKCTWAVVGMLFNNSWKEWENNKPEILPDYENSALSAYKFGDKNFDKVDEFYCFAPELINLIKQTNFQEIGTHTNSHYYCLEAGQSLDSFKADLAKAKDLAEAFDIQLNSLVFPRNQFNDEYLEACYSAGIKTVRINPDSWYWKNTQQDRLLDKIFRTGDAYIGTYDKSYRLSEVQTYKNAVVLQKSSRFLRPFENSFQNKLKLKRIKKEMRHAAEYNQVYHLWWHPHNFGNDPNGALQELKEIIDFYNKCKIEYGFQSATMNEIAEMVLKDH